MQVMDGTVQFPPAHSPLPTPGKGGTQELGIYEKLLIAGLSYYPELSRPHEQEQQRNVGQEGRLVDGKVQPF